MQFLRSRSFAVCFLFLFLQSLFTPYYALALTSGPHQPEYTSYEDAGSTDMVNLLTGDFNFNMPLIEVPGPEGSFSLPLSYHAGIGLEQEASWVGLGWNVNAGAIVRNVNQYPDDASGEANRVTVQDMTGITGWNRTFNHPFRDDWNSQTGYHGNVNLMDIVEVDFGSYTSVGIVGVHVGDNGVSFNPVQFMSAASSLVSLGMTSAGTSAASIAKQSAIDLTISTAMSFAMPVNTPGAGTSGNWTYSKSAGRSKFKVHKGSFIHWAATGIPVPIVSKKKSYKMWLDQTRLEKMFGVLNLSGANSTLMDTPFFPTRFPNSHVRINSGPMERLKMFSNAAGGVSDINYTLDDSWSYPGQKTATVLATDDYTVNAPGVSGSITPYRLEVGSVSMPRQMSQDHYRLAPLPYLDYKVPFIYEGSLFNKYLQHVGAETGSPNSPSFRHGVTSTYSNLAPYTSPYFEINLEDATFTQRLEENVEATKKIPQGNHIEWFTNAEIIEPLSSTVQNGPSKFIDFLSAVGPGNAYQQSDRFMFRSHVGLGTGSTLSSYPVYMPNFGLSIPIIDPSFLSTLNVGSIIQIAIWDDATYQYTNVQTSVVAKDGIGITIQDQNAFHAHLNQPLQFSILYPGTNTVEAQNGIGGYSITSADGTTYHFALPVYDYSKHSVSISTSDPGKSSSLVRDKPFANSWLLTAITGPDYVDRNSNGLADHEDWGYWVKMNYGKYSDTFEWRIPLSGEMTDATGAFKSFERGKKQLYYLNSIETRSHVAVFMKSPREDGRSVNDAVVPLKLDEVCLLKKEQYSELLNAYGITDYSNTINTLCYSSDFVDLALRSFINTNCIKRVVFSYDYSLCKNTPNAGGAANPNGGKLTLKSIGIKGRNDIKVVPDYKFEYNTANPNYNPNAWDGWGAYNSDGTSSYLSHKTSSQASSDGSAWSLSKIVTPLGSEILVNYERDSYSSVSGEKVYKNRLLFNNTLNVGTAALDFIDVAENPFQIGQQVKISGDAHYTCPSDVSPKTTHINVSRIIEDIQSSSNGFRIYLDEGILQPDCSQSGALSITLSGEIVNGWKQGGNIRVASISLVDPTGRSNKQRYLYEDETNSFGVVAQEPDYIKNQHYEFYDYLKYPQTPVMYGKVTILSGTLSNDQDYNSKQVFEFETPHKSQFSVEAADQDPSRPTAEMLYKIQDRSAQIGKLKSVKVYDRNGRAISESRLYYTDHIENEDGVAYQGTFTEGTLLNDHSYQEEGGNRYFGNNSNRTTVVTYPYTLKRIVNKRDELISSTENLRWDLLTGMVTESIDKSSLGIYVKTVSRPAYKFYPEMGSMSTNIDNKNMLLQNAATYLYRADPMGNTLGLITAEAQTWNKEWSNYRHLDANNEYVDEGVQAHKVWRKGKAYVWKGDIGRRQADYGTQSFTSADEFNFAGTNPLWQFVGETTRFDHFGMPLESKDRNGIYATVKMGYDNRTVLASASNARYNEIAFSSAEDKIPGVAYFGGEVALGSGVQVLSPVHTGNTALSVDAGSGSHGFVFKPGDLLPGKRYRVSVWANNNANGLIYYKANNGSEIVPSQTVSQAVAIPGSGNWYRIDLTFENPEESIIEVGVKASSGTVVFDDFRFQPADAVMTCYVHQPLDYKFTIPPTQYSPSFSYTLDNDNVFTKVEANEKGEVVKVYSESLTYGVKLISETKTHYRRNSIDPQ